MNLNPLPIPGAESDLVIFVGPYVSKPSSENMPKQQSGLRIRTKTMSFTFWTSEEIPYQSIFYHSQ